MLHEDIERREKALVALLEKPPKNVWVVCVGRPLSKERGRARSRPAPARPRGVASPVFVFFISLVLLALQHKEAVIQDHTIQAFSNDSVRDMTELSRLYADADGLRKTEIASITSVTVFTSFYDRLRAIREYHAKFPEAATPDDEELPTPTRTVTVAASCPPCCCFVVFDFWPESRASPPP